MRSALFEIACYVFLLHLWKIDTVICLWDEENTSSECSKLIKEVAELNKNTKIIFPPPLIGKWVSERCEIRAGPRYLLRSYKFYPNNTFYLVQFYYNDESCSSVSYTITASGTYRLRTYSTSATSFVKLSYDLHKVTVIPHDIRSADDLSDKLYMVCPNIAEEYWMPFTEYTIFKRNKKQPNFEDEISDNSYHKFARTTSGLEKNQIRPQLGIKCLSSIDLSFDELHSLRVQIRPSDDEYRYELLLGNVYQYSNRRRQMMRNQFQLPLILINESNNCLICDVVSKSTNMFVHHLPAKPILPLHVINGEWISDRCEAQSTGMFLNRNFKIDYPTLRWELETKYYSNYICSNLIMIHRTFGHFYEDMPSITVSGAIDVIFKTYTSHLTLINEFALDIIQTDPLCGIRDYWEVGISKEIPSRYGCPTVGITNFAMKSNIVRLDTDEKGSYILYLGDGGIKGEMPTTYQYPLLRCDSDLYNLLQFGNDYVPDSATSIYKSEFVVILLAANLILLLRDFFFLKICRVNKFS